MYWGKVVGPRFLFVGNMFDFLGAFLSRRTVTLVSVVDASRKTEIRVFGIYPESRDEKDGIRFEGLDLNTHLWCIGAGAFGSDYYGTLKTDLPIPEEWREHVAEEYQLGAPTA